MDDKNTVKKTNSSKSMSAEQLLKIAQSCLPRENFAELEELYKETTAKDQALIDATIEQIKKFKKPIIAQLLSIFGIFGVDRFYVGDKRSGLTKLCTLGVLLVMWFYDMFTIRKRTKHLNYVKLRKAMGVEIEEFDLDKLNKGEN